MFHFKRRSPVDYQDAIVHECSKKQREIALENEERKNHKPSRNKLFISENPCHEN